MPLTIMGLDQGGLYPLGAHGNVYMLQAYFGIVDPELHIPGVYQGSPFTT